MPEPDGRGVGVRAGVAAGVGGGAVGAGVGAAVGAGVGGAVGTGVGAGVGTSAGRTVKASAPGGNAPDPQLVDVDPPGLSEASPVHVMTPAADAVPVTRMTASSCGGVRPTRGYLSSGFLMATTFELGPTTVQAATAGPEAAP